MRRASGFPAICALLMLAWPAAARSQPRLLHVALCDGGTIEIPIGGGDPNPRRHDPGCVTACHAVLGTRKRSG